MSDTDPLAPVLGTSDRYHPAQQGPQRTLRGALATVALALVLFTALAAPTPILVALLLAPVAAGVFALTVGYRRRRHPRHFLRLCLPWTDRCVQI